MVPGHEFVDAAIGPAVGEALEMSFGQARGSTPFIFAVCGGQAMVARVRPPPSTFDAEVPKEISIGFGRPE